MPRRDNLVLLPVHRRESLSVRVVQILKRYILAEGLEVDDRLPPERSLAESLNVSRTVLREALGQLSSEGIVYRRSPRTLCVADFDRRRLAAELAPLDEPDAELQDLIELRAVVEIGAIEAIVQRATDEHLREIEHWVVEGERKVAAHEPLLLTDARFHAALLGALGNRSINALLPLIEENLRRNITANPHQISGKSTPDEYRVVAEHRRIFEAVMRRDVDTARLVMLVHLSPYLRRE